MRTVIFSFKSTKILGLLEEAGISPFIFHKLKEDIERFNKLIIRENPDRIIGFAITHRSSQFESRAVNRFNNGKVTQGGSEQYSLYIPQAVTGAIKTSSGFSTTFCNWVMYKLSELVADSSCKLSFVHLNPKDKDQIHKIIETVQSEDL